MTESKIKTIILYAIYLGKISVDESIKKEYTNKPEKLFEKLKHDIDFYMKNGKIEDQKITKSVINNFYNYFI